MTLLERDVDGKKIVWLGDRNQYLILEEPVYQVFRKLLDEAPPELIVEWCLLNYDFPVEDGQKLVASLQELINLPSDINNIQAQTNSAPICEIQSEPVTLVNYYRIHDRVIKVTCDSAGIQFCYHPQLAHLEIPFTDRIDNHIRLDTVDGELILSNNGIVVEKWSSAGDSYILGRFFLEMINLSYGKNSSDWMALFHASAISDGQHSIIFLGESGSGKSTIAACLMSSGFDFLADDFVILDKENGHVFVSPGALSVKRQAVAMLLPHFPQLSSLREYYYPLMQKNVRYLPPVNRHTERSNFPCRALVYVKYRKNSGSILESLPKSVAFQQLFPDSWISPEPEIASRFLDWFLEIPCYQLTYSDNDAMVDIIRGLLNKRDAGDGLS